MVSALTLICVLLPLAFASEGGHEWNYGNCAHWGDADPKCFGKQQSPIALVTSESTTPQLAPLKFTNYDKALFGTINLSNNGHSVEFSVPKTVKGDLPTISGGNLPGKFEAVGVHFHWGSKGVKGSEHTVDGRQFDAEMHIVHKNVKYASVPEAVEHADGLAVLGVLFEAPKTLTRTYPALSEIFDRLPKLVDYQSTTPLKKTMSLSHLLGDLHTTKFFSYSGSLTTPGCGEAVTWHVFPEPLQISMEHLQNFWGIKDAHGQPLVNNFRPLQDRNDRPLYYNNA
ncbi:carbonic anhydrase 2 [Stomoxys calcitrans]|uniref:Carbonic anhydrase n=1 Tax=Stomoxys calcitrans TaxID=35570 RepID=A0A1I8PRF9_STOCA|nr:carbonic anhydrase 2 [Stomoxys calcitrans]